MNYAVSSRHRRPRAILLGLFLLLSPANALAQRAGVPIEPRRLPHNDKAVMAKLEALRGEGKLLSMSEARAALESPSPQKIALAQPATEPLSPQQLAQRGRRALLRIGWYYLCHRCNNWHLQIANGYALTADGIAVTCHHALVPNPDTMREAYLFAMNTHGEVFPIASILAVDAKLDAAIIRIDGSGFVPVALNDQTAPGDAVYLFSDPRSIAGYFSAGQINRFYWDGPRGDENLESLETVRNLRIDVSTDWAPGSSGAAIMDIYGNAIGHVTEIAVERESPPSTTLPSPAPEVPMPATNPATNSAARPSPPRNNLQGAYLLVLHEAVPARGVRLLVEANNAKAE